MDTPETEKLKSIFGSAELEWLLRRLRERFERGSAANGRLSLPLSLQPNQREALNRLLGRRISLDARSFALEELNAILAAAGIGTLREAIERLTGPLIDQTKERSLAAARWEGLFNEARTLLANRRELLDWLEDLQRTGLLRRYAEQNPEVARDLLATAFKVTLALPADGLALSELSASVLGDSHALDHGTKLSTLVLRAALSIARTSGDAVGTDPASKTALRSSEGRRAIWENVGVYCDELSASVLVLNLAADPGSLSGMTLSVHAGQGEPCRLTLRELLRHPPDFGARYGGRTVYVCENPTVVAHMADRFGSHAPPLVCIEGKPRTSAARLLDALTNSGASLRYHGDFDWEGIRIANFVLKRFGALPWRMSAADYDEASPRGGGELSGPPVVAAWDAALADRMRTTNRFVHEEALLDLLCADLADFSPQMG